MVDSRHSDPDEPDSGMISVRDLAKRIEQDKATSTTGHMFPSTGELKPARREWPSHTGPMQAARPFPPASRVEQTDQFPAITAPVAEDPPPERKAATRLAAGRLRRQAKALIAGRAATALIAAVALAATGAGWRYLNITDATFTQIAALSPTATASSQDNYLIAGVDGAALSTVMLVSMPADRSRATITSYPHTMAAARPECEGWDKEKSIPTAERYPAAAHEQLDFSYAMGGPRCLVRMMQRLTGQPIGHYIGVTATGIAAMVDTVGGVGICTRAGGTHIIDGAAALTFLHTGADRVAREQKLLPALLSATVSSTGSMRAFVDAFAQHSTVAKVTVDDLLGLARSIRAMPAGAVTLTTPPGQGSQNVATPAITAPSPKSAAELPPQVAVSPSSVSLKLFNGTGQTGIAATVAKKLTTQEFSVGGYETYPQGESTATIIKYNPTQLAKAATLATALPEAQLVEDPDLGKTLQVVLGTDFAGSVTTPTATGKRITAPLRNGADVPAVTEPAPAPPLVEPANACL